MSYENLRALAEHEAQHGLPIEKYALLTRALLAALDCLADEDQAIAQGWGERFDRLRALDREAAP